eukprot:Opistho-2@62397
MDALLNANYRTDVVVDHSTFDALDDDPTDFAFRQELAVEFLSERITREPFLDECYAKNDFNELHEAAHKDESGALTLGFNKVANIYLRIELRSKLVNDRKIGLVREDFESDFAALKREYAVLKTYLENFFGAPFM